MAEAASCVDHLEELRRRLWVSVITFLVASILCYPLAARLLATVRDDLLGNVPLIVLSPLEAVSVNVKFSFLLGFALSLPVLTYEFWRFFSPGLNAREKRILAVALVPSVILFLVGVAFAYKVLLPVMLKFMIEEAYPVAVPMLSLGETFSFILFMLLVTGLSFQLPLVVAALSKVGVIDYRMLSSTRRYVIVAIFLFAAVVTPDPTLVSQLLVAAPMLLLYEISVQISRFL